MILASGNRIKDKGRIDQIKKRGRLLQGEDFGVSYLKNESSDKPKFAFIISTKINKLAVQRNRINRSLHEGVRKVLNIIPKSFDFVFLAKKSIVTKSKEEIIYEVENFFNKTNIS